MEERSQKGKNRGLIHRFLPYFKPYWKVMVFDLFCASMTTVCELVLPLIVRYITDMGMNDLQALTVPDGFCCWAGLSGAAGH